MKPPAIALRLCLLAASEPKVVADLRAILARHPEAKTRAAAPGGKKKAAN
jgi:hypothetical protein